MRTISRTAKFKKDSEREAEGQHSATLDADLLAALSFLATDQALPDLPFKKERNGNPCG